MATLSTACTFVSNVDLKDEEGSLVKHLADGKVDVAGAGEMVLGVVVHAVLKTIGDGDRNLTNEGLLVAVETEPHMREMKTAVADDVITPGMILAADGTGDGVAEAAVGDFPIGRAMSASKGGCVDVRVDPSLIALV